MLEADDREVVGMLFDENGNEIGEIVENLPPPNKTTLTQFKGIKYFSNAGSRGETQASQNRGQEELPSADGHNTQSLLAGTRLPKIWSVRHKLLSKSVTRKCFRLWTGSRRIRWLQFTTLCQGKGPHQHTWRHALPSRVSESLWCILQPTRINCSSFALFSTQRGNKSFSLSFANHKMTSFHRQACLTDHGSEKVFAGRSLRWRSLRGRHKRIVEWTWTGTFKRQNSRIRRISMDKPYANRPRQSKGLEVTANQ